MSSLEQLQNGRYAVLKRLGEGGKGVVYKARDTVLNRVVAIKVLKSAVSGEEAYSRFIREAQAVAKLNHPNIVSIHDIGKEGERQFFVLEFVDGTSLRELMKTYPEGKCDIQTVLRLGIDVCSGLCFAHSQGVLHRDLKPENILVTEDGVAKLMDFGLAKMLDQPGITQEGIIVGTVAYVAPENALGKGSDARSDLYSLGAVLYEASTGKPPFPGEDPVKVIFGHIHDYPVSPGKLNPKTPQALTDCIMRLLEKEPARRYQSATDLLSALREIAEGYLRETFAPVRKPSVIVPIARPHATKELQLIDRLEEMSLLRDAVDRAVGGEGGVVFLYGEAGIGKTRLTRELGAYARLRGMQVLYGRCPALFRMDGVPPYVLWSQVIKDYLQSCSPEQLYKVIGFYPGELFKLVPEIKQKLRGIISESLPINPERGRDRLFEAVSQFVTNISKETPLLVILDDLQWTDQTSLLLLHYLARSVNKESLLLLGAYRDTDVDDKHALFPVLTELNRERLLQSAQLKRMSFDDASEMVRRILEQDEVPTEFCELVFEKTRGNPFFAEEVIKSLKEEGVIYREDDKWRIKIVSEIEFPKTVKSVIKARLGRLDEECQHVLTLASFVGNDFSCEAMCGVSGIEEDRLLELIEKLLKTGLVKHRVIRGEDMCSFADIIVRDVLYEEVSPFRRKKLHGDVGRALEKVYAKKIDEHFGELALHFLEGGDKEKALEYFLKAGEKAANIYANNEAASYFQSALRLLEEKEDLHEKVRVLERLGDVKKLIGEYDACMQYWNDAARVLTKLQEKSKTATLHRKMANILWDKIGDAEGAKEHHETCLRILQTEPESVENARLYHDMAYMQWRNGDYVKAFASAEKALVLAEKLGALEVVADACLDLCMLLWFSGDFKKSREYANRALKIALDNDYLDIAILAYDRVGGFLPSEEYEKRLECFEKGLSLARKVGDISRQSWFLGDLADTYLGMGELDKATTLGEEALALDKKVGSIAYTPGILSLLGLAYQALGEWSKSEQYYDEAVAISRKLTDLFPKVDAHFLYGWLCFDKEEYARARESFEKAYKMVERTGMRSSPMFISQLLILVSVEMGEIEKAQSLLEALQKFALETEDKWLSASEMTLRAILLRAQKKYYKSIELFEETLQEWESIKANIWNAYFFARWVLFEYARVYLERNEEGDREKANRLLNRALEMFQKMGAKKDIEKIIAKKKLITS